MTNTTAPCADEVLEYWFGHQTQQAANSKQDDDHPHPHPHPHQPSVWSTWAWRAGLWWRGADANLSSKTMTPLQLRDRTDAFIAEHFQLSKLLEDSVVPLSEDVDHHLHLHNQIEDAFVPQSVLWHWIKRDWFGRVATVIVLDQFTRNAYRGTARMFRYDVVAQQVARHCLEEYASAIRKSTPSPSPSPSPPPSPLSPSMCWPHVLFLCVALMHSEDIDTVRQSLNGIRALIVDLESIVELGEDDGDENRDPKMNFTKIIMRLKGSEKAAVSHLSMLANFSRYPYRNTLIGRESTPEEEEFLKGDLPNWSTSVFKKKSSSHHANTSMGMEMGVSPKKLQVLVLHSQRQNASAFQKRTRGVLSYLRSFVNLVFVDAPHLYHPSGEASVVSDIAPETVNSENRSWFNSTDDPESMVYNGLSESIAYLDNYARAHGPFDGIIGFSQV